MDVLDTLNSLQQLSDDEIKRQQEEKRKISKPSFHFDRLKMFFGEDYEIGGIKISIPTIGEILNIGEQRYYDAIRPFLNNPTSVRVLLYDTFKKDWNKTKEIEVFYILLQLVKDKMPLRLIFKDIDFSDFELICFDKKTDYKIEQTYALISKSQQLLINEDTYIEIAEYIRCMMNVHPKVEKAKGRTTKLWILQEDRMKMLRESDKENKSHLLSLVSSCLNHPGFKYTLDELKNVNICQFMDSVNRIQKYEQGIAALHGLFGGMIDAKAIPKDTLNFMGEY